MWHVPSGTSGLIVALVVPFAIWVLVRSLIVTAKGPFNLDPNGVRGAFEPFLQKYLRVGEFIVGLATGSIVLLVGSSALHGNGGHLPWFYASPLLMLAICVIYGIAFMVWFVYHYEDYQHDTTQHTRFAYALSLTVGFSSLACFCIGYIWLILCVVK